MPDKIKKSYKEIGVFDREAREYLKRKGAEWKAANPESKAAPPSSKFTYAINRVLKRSQSILEDWQELFTEIDIRHASEDKEKNLATNELGRFKYTKEALIDRNKEQREGFRSEVEIEPYYATATQVPDDLTDEDKEIFYDFVMERPKE